MQPTEVAGNHVRYEFGKITIRFFMTQDGILQWTKCSLAGERGENALFVPPGQFNPARRQAAAILSKQRRETLQQ